MCSFPKIQRSQHTLNQICEGSDLSKIPIGDESLAMDTVSGLITVRC